LQEAPGNQKPADNEKDIYPQGSVTIPIEGWFEVACTGNDERMGINYQQGCHEA
jgi:hypothetical protein